MARTKDDPARAFFELDELGRSALPAAAEQLAGRAGHQLANLLTPLAGCMEMLVADPDSLPLFADSLPTLDHSVRRIGIHIENLLLCRRGAPMANNAVVLQDAVDRAIEKLHAAGYAIGHDVRFSANQPASKLQARGDMRLVSHLILNLLVNAAEAMSVPGSIHATLQATDRASTITIRDCGPGFGPEVQTRLFDPFFSTKGNASGIGLGLYVCRSIADRISATVRVENSPGGGAVATIQFPRTN